MAIVLSKQLPPIRPRKALVNTTLPDLQVQEIKEILESLNYPDSFISYLMCILLTLSGERKKIYKVLY